MGGLVQEVYSGRQAHSVATVDLTTGHTDGDYDAGLDLPVGISGPEKHRTKYGGGPTGAAGERIYVVFARDARVYPIS